MTRLRFKVMYVAVTVLLLLSQSAFAFVTTSALAFSQRSLTQTASGYRNNSSGGLNNVSSNGNYWSSAANSATNAYNLNFNSGNVNPLNNNNRANGFSVRPVRAFEGPKTDFFAAMTISKEELHKLLVLAYLDARQNERNKTSQLAFELNLERNLDDLCNLLYSREWEPLPAMCFIIEWPVKREVFAPRFPDRIVSHLLFNMIAPLFERTLIYDSYSCRKGKGTLFGVERFEHHIRSATDNYQHEAFVLNFDISGYFMNINKGILYNTLCKTLDAYRFRHVDGQRIWNDVIDINFVDFIIRRLLFRNPAESCIRVGDIHEWDDLPKHKSLFFSPLGTGITIGDLTSQLFSNIHLNPLDQYIKRELHVKHYGRYVDDGRIIHRDTAFLEDCIPAVASFLHDRMILTLHPHKCTITSAFDDVFFLGAHCRPYRRYAANKTVASFHRAVHDMEFAFNSGYALTTDDFTKALSRMNSYLGYFQHFKEFKMLDATLRDSSLKQIFVFSKDYRKALFRPEIKQQLQNNIIYA